MWTALPEIARVTGDIRNLSLAQAEVAEMAIPPIIDMAEFEAVQTRLKTPSPALTAPRVVSGPTLSHPPYRHLLLRRLRRDNGTENRKERQVQVLHLLHQGPAGRDRLQGPNGPYGKLDSVVAEHIKERL